MATREIFRTIWAVAFTGGVVVLQLGTLPASAEATPMPRNSRGVATSEKTAPAFAAWSAMQATGAPDATLGVDDGRAWASSAPDAGREWLEAEIDRPVALRGIRIVQSFNPGAVVSVILVDEQGEEVSLWTVGGKGANQNEVFDVEALGRVGRKVRIELNTARVGGWNEIDAVGFIDAKGVSNWAQSVTASSTYGIASSPFSHLMGQRVTVVLDGGIRVEGIVRRTEPQALTLSTTATPSREILILRERVLMIERMAK